MKLLSLLFLAALLGAAVLAVGVILGALVTKSSIREAKNGR